MKIGPGLQRESMSRHHGLAHKNLSSSDRFPPSPGGNLSEEDFTRFSLLIQKTCGIKMPLQKRSMLEARLRKRLRSLPLGSFKEYGEFLFSEEGLQKELQSFVDAITTNKTDFFREPKHFDFLAHVTLPGLVRSYGAGVNKPLRVWSAGCSSGEEAYSLAMVLAEFAATRPGFEFEVLATDISVQVLEKANLAIYRGEKGEAVPEPLKNKYLLRSKCSEKNLLRVVPELRAKVGFRRLNFMDEDFGFREPMDVIFFRNVMIYFDRDNQASLLDRLCRHLLPGRYLFTGHSETLHGMGLPLEQVAPSVYQKR
jgi:chemotaxis protein methyltransferase CheR